MSLFTYPSVTKCFFCQNVDKQMTSMISSFLYLWMFHFSEKKFVIRLSTKHDGKKKKSISTSIFVPFIRCEKRNSLFSYQINDSKIFYGLFYLTAEKSFPRVKWKAEVFFCQSVKLKKKIGLCSRLIIGVITSLHIVQWHFP